MHGLPADLHVHTQWSWDAGGGDMEATCRRAVELGLPAIAFTEHADFTPWVRAGEAVAHGTRPVGIHRPDGDLDVAGYWECIDRCRAAFPALRIRSGVELGEAHRFVPEVNRILAVRPMDLILGSSHCIPFDGVLTDMSARGFLDPESAAAKMRTYFEGTLELVETCGVFAVLTHVDYPKRYWPHDRLAYDEGAFEGEYRAVLRALARSGRALEVNTSRGIDPRRGLCPGPRVLRWWYEEGGGAVSFGSDAHDPRTITAGFAAATDAATAAGFRPAADPGSFWLR